MLSALKGITCDIRVPVVNSRTDNDVNVLALNHFRVIRVSFGVATNVINCLLGAGFGNVTGTGNRDIIVSGISLDRAYVRHTLATNTDKSNHDPVIGSNDASGRWCLVLTINR